MQVKQMFTERFIFGPSKANAYRLKKKSCNIKEPKECISTWQTLKAKYTHFRTAGVVQDCHNSLISAFLISQLDLLPTRSHSRSFKLGVGVVIAGPFI